MSRTKRAEMDMIHGSIWNKIPQFALPIAATAILGQLFNASDLAVVGNFTGEARNACVAAVSSNSAIVSLVVNFFVGIGLGANVVIANALGRDDGIWWKRPSIRPFCFPSWAAFSWRPSAKPLPTASCPA